MSICSFLLYVPGEMSFIVSTITPIKKFVNSYLFNEFVCNFDFFWHEWTSLKLE
jgi:hypothetical protein